MQPIHKSYVVYRVIRERAKEETWKIFQRLIDSDAASDTGSSGKRGGCSLIDGLDGGACGATRENDTLNGMHSTW